MSAQSGVRPGLPDNKVLLAFALFVLVSGGASVAIRITYVELPPFWAATARFALAAITFWIFAFVKKIPVPRGRALLGSVLFGTLTVGLSFSLIAWGLVEIPASLYQILMATVPLLTLFLTAIQRVEKLTIRGLMGSLLAIMGIAISVGGSSAVNISWLHILSVIVAATFMAQGGVLLKKFPPNPPVITNAIAMSTGALILGAVSLLSNETWILPTQARTWTAFLYLVFVVTLAAFMLYIFVLRNWTASGSSYGFVMIPLVTIVVASTIAGEEITTNFLLGGALVLAGVLIGALLPNKKDPDPVEECKDRSGQVLPRCA